MEENKQIKLNKNIHYFEGDFLSDIMKFPIGNNKKIKCNNIIYYDENINNNESKFKDIFLLEKNTPGGFIFTSNLESLKIIREEILNENTKNKKMIFNLITTNNTFEKLIRFLEGDIEFNNCIKNKCIYCSNIDNYLSLKEKSNILYNDIYKSIKEVINFIESTSSSEIIPFRMKKIVTYEEYLDTYKNIHLKISKFYGDLTPETYKINYEKIKSVIKNKAKENNILGKEQKILDGFSLFNIKDDLDSLNELIIKESSKNSYYRDLNSLLFNIKSDIDDSIAYFTSRLMYSLNSYAQKNNMFCLENNKDLYRGFKLPYSSLLKYERAKGKIILFLGFTSTTDNYNICKKFGSNSLNLLFSVYFYIKNKFKNNWISSVINIQNISFYKSEKEYIIQPFTFFYVIDVQIDTRNYKADIYLETIGKTEILEDKIKIGKKIYYNENEKIMEIKEN